MNRRSTGQIVAVALGLLLVAILLGRPGSDGPPLDPESVGELGTLGLVEFLERSGATIEPGVPDADSDAGVVLVLSDRLNGQSREDLLDWIKAGGHAVITDPGSPLIATGITGTASGEDLARGACPVAGLDGVETLAARSLALLVPVPNSSVCFGDDDGAYILRFDEGEGMVTALGGATPFVNRQFDEGDNAVLAGRLLLDTAGTDGTIALLYSPVADGLAQQSPLDLVGSNVRWFGWQLVAVSLIGVLWAIRRFGPLVAEPEVVELPGSLSVRATAELHRRSGTPEQSATSIRRHLNGRIRARFRLPPEVDAEHAAAIIAEQTGVGLGDARILTGAVVNNGDPLDRLKQLDSIGRSVFGDDGSGDDALIDAAARSPRHIDNAAPFALTQSPDLQNDEVPSNV